MPIDVIDKGQLPPSSTSPTEYPKVFRNWWGQTKNQRGRLIIVEECKQARAWVIPASEAEPALSSTRTGLSLGNSECRQMGPVPLPGPLGSIGSKHQLMEMLCSILNI